MRIDNEQQLTLAQIAELAPGCIRMHSGEYVNPLNAKPEEIHIEDIAQGLAHTFRWRGQCKAGQISVIRHSVQMAMSMKKVITGDVRYDHYMHQKLVRTALLHDATEAYIADIPKPVKMQMPEYDIIEDGLASVIAQRFDLIHPLPAMIKELDWQFLQLEWKDKMLNKELTIEGPVWSELFMEVYNEHRIMP